MTIQIKRVQEANAIRSQPLLPDGRPKRNPAYPVHWAVQCDECDRVLGIFSEERKASLTKELHQELHDFGIK